MNKGEQEGGEDLLRIEGVNAKGYGCIPKAVMKDRRLTLYAKAIYAYFRSYAGSGNRAFPSRATILYGLQINLVLDHSDLAYMLNNIPKNSFASREEFECFITEAQERTPCIIQFQFAILCL